MNRFKCVQIVRSSVFYAASLIFIKHLEGSKIHFSLLLEIYDWSPEKILSFQMCFDEMIKKAYHWDLWGACAIMEGDVSKEHFIYFILGIIAKGKEVFYHAIENAHSLAELNLSDFLCNLSDFVCNQEMELVTEKEFESKTDNKMPRELK